jgi:hypothetical protein
MPGYHKTDMSTLKVFQLAFLLLAGATRLGSLAASDHTVLILGEVNETSPVEEMAFAKIASLLTEIKEPTTGPTQISTNALASLGCGKVLSEFIGMLLTTAIAIALANSWKRKHTGFTAESDCTSVPNDTELEVQQESEEPPQELPSQAELDWVDAARAGAMRLTDEVYCAAVEWWLGFPLASTFKSMGSRDQKLFKPVSELVRQGRTEEGCNLMEQIGRLDRVERELLRPSRSLGSQPLQAAMSTSRSPLCRSAPDLAVSAALMRKWAESDPSAAPRLAYRQATLFDAAPAVQASVVAAPRSAPVLVRSSAEAHREPVAFNECYQMPAYACGA